MKLIVPILTILPIPYIRIDEMEIDFTAKLSDAQTSTVDSESYQAGDSQSSSHGSGYGNWWWPGGNAGYNHNSSYSSSHQHISSSSGSSTSRYQTEYTMNVRLKAVQDDLPTGLSKILDILHGAIQEEPLAIEEINKVAQEPETQGEPSDSEVNQKEDDQQELES